MFIHTIIEFPYKLIFHALIIIIMASCLTNMPEFLVVISSLFVYCRFVKLKQIL